MAAEQDDAAYQIGDEVRFSGGGPTMIFGYGQTIDNGALNGVMCYWADKNQVYQLLIPLALLTKVKKAKKDNPPEPTAPATWSPGSPGAV